MSPPGRRSRPAGNGPAQIVVAGRQGDKVIVPPASDEIPLFDAVSPSGDILRERGAALVEDATDDQGIAVVDQAIRSFGEMYGDVNANNVRHLIPVERQTLLPARFLALARQGRLEKVGFVKATHPAGHGRWIAQWRWVGDQ